MEIDLAQPGADLPALASSALTSRLRSQVCIVGGGIAGLILAHRLMLAGHTVTLLEAGGRHPPPAASDGDPFAAELSGRPHAGTREGRVRALGGSSATWGGQLLPLPDDAQWPVAVAEIRRYERNLQLPYDAAAFFSAHRTPFPKLLRQLPELTPRLSRFIPFPMRNLAGTLGKQLLSSPLARVVLHASVTELVLAATGDHVAGVTVHAPDGRCLRIEADQYVLAAGTVESCRLLLASRSVASEGVGNTHGQVGLHFHDHLTVPATEFTGKARERILAELRPWVFAERRQPQTLYSLKLEPAATFRAEFGLQAAMAHLTIDEPDDSGVGALRSLLRARQQAASVATWARHAGALPGMAVQAARLAWEAQARHRRYVSPEARVSLQFNVAQAAPAASRVTLSQATDRWGMPKAVVHWQISTGELASFRHFASYLRTHLAAVDIDDGVIWRKALFADDAQSTQDLLASLGDARHAMGGARMGIDPQRSVVDPDLTVHGVRNLSVASAAVFPDGSAQLPTLTLSALCLRLAERLHQQLR